MSRFPHRLKRNHGNEMPSNIIWVDTETKFKLDDAGRQHHYLWFGWAVYQRREHDLVWSKPEWLRFTDVATFWEWVNSKCRQKTRLHLFAHNWGFDLPVLKGFTEVPKMGFKLVSAVVDAPPIILKWQGDRRSIRAIDTLNIWRLPLAAIGESIGCPKLEMPDKSASTEEWDIYGQRDTEIIRRAVLGWFEFLVTHDLGGFSPTLASQAFNAYRHRFMPTPIFIDAKEKALDLSRRAYVGGRTECFKVGAYTGDFYYLDVNSMYPAVMQREKFPYKLVGLYQRPTKKELAEWMKHFSVVGEVTIETELPIYPIVEGKKLIFPVGRFRTVLAAPELAEAISRGHASQVHQVALYDHARLFKQWVDEIYALRLKAKEANNVPETWRLKILMNSLYGKFGQRGRHYENHGEAPVDEIGVWTEVDADSGEVFKYRKFGGLVQHWVEESESQHSFPAIAATVTSYARLLLWRAIERMGLSNVYYCDTDSIVCNRAGYERIKSQIHASRLGAWALERQFNTCEIHGPKDYTFGTQTRTKGVRRNALWLNSNTVEQDCFVGMRGLLREQNLNGPIVFKLQKKLSRIYTKGEVQPDGTVSPLRLTETG